MEERTYKILDFLKEISKFKEIEREIYYTNGRRETDAEHVWHLIMFLFLFEKELPGDIDFKRTIKIDLVHDLPEIYAGDILDLICFLIPIDNLFHIHNLLNSRANFLEVCLGLDL